METKVKEVRWTEKASVALEEVYSFYEPKSVEAAEKVLNEIIDKAESIVFPEQYQRDTISPEYRRMVVRDYIILYEVEEQTIHVINVVCAKKPR